MENTVNKTAENYIGIAPGVRRALGYGWDKMKANFLIFLLIIFVLAIVDARVQLFQEKVDGHGWSEISVLAGLFLFLYILLFQPIIEFSADLMFLRGVRGEKVDPKEIIVGFNNYINIVLSSLLVFGLVGISLFFLIIPGIIVGCRLVFVSYLVMDEDMSPIEAVETSWKITKGHGWKVFRLAFVSIFIVILGILCLIVGIFPAIMWVKSAFAALYLSITGTDTPVSPDQTEGS